MKDGIALRSLISSKPDSIQMLILRRCISTPKPTSSRCRSPERSPGSGGFGPQAAIYFYGTGIDTAFSGTRVYWLVAGAGQGARIPQTAAFLGIEPASGRLSCDRRAAAAHHLLFGAAHAQWREFLWSHRFLHSSGASAAPRLISMRNQLSRRGSTLCCRE